MVICSSEGGVWRVECLPGRIAVVRWPRFSPHFVAGSQKRFYGEMKDRARSGPVTDLENDSVIAITAAGRSFVAESTGGDIRED